jgi:hypothetical protein
MSSSETVRWPLRLIRRRARQPARRLSRRLVAAAVLLLPPQAFAQGDWLDRFLEVDLGDAPPDVFDALPRDPQALADQLSAEVAGIRGLEFRDAIAVSHQSMADFEVYLDAEIEQSIPSDRVDAFGRVAHKLGFYRGPVIEDAAAVMRQLATSQVAAYYDTDRSEFFVLLADAPPVVLAPIYAHELFHGLQDQYFDLDAFLLDGMQSGLNDDEILARQAVVEGEATYIMNLWLMEKLMGRPLPRLLVSATVLAQSMLTSSSLAALASSEALLGGAGEELQASAEAMEDIPNFMLETMIGAYLKGMAFVHTIAGQGWDEVGRLYTEPPRSTEQILHPAKWLERDDPVTIEFPALADEPALAGWRLLESNVIGEFQLRVIFQEFSTTAEAAHSAAGWDGDRYAVLERGDELLLLLYTRWDDEAEAEEFAAAYSDLLAAKYDDGSEPTLVERRGTDVLIVEGGNAGNQSDYLAILGRAVVTDAP